MASTLAPTDLLRQLEALAHCPLAGECLHIRAQLPHQVKSLQIDRPVLGLVLHGEKRLSTPQQQLQLRSGDLFLGTGRSQVDAFNAPDPASQRYLSMTLTLCDEVLQAARILWAQPVQADTSRLVGLPATQVAPTLAAWCRALQQGHYEQARVALVDLVLYLCRQGHHALLAPAAAAPGRPGAPAGHRRAPAPLAISRCGSRPAHQRRHPAPQAGRRGHIAIKSIARRAHGLRARAVLHHTTPGQNRGCPRGLPVGAQLCAAVSRAVWDGACGDWEWE